MASFNVHETKTNLSKLLKRVVAGETIVIARSGKPVAKLVPYSSEHADRKEGLDRSHVHILPEFDAPLPEEELEAFES